MPFIIRKAKPEDLLKISKLNLELFNIQHQFDPTANLNWTMSEDGQEYFKKRISQEDSFTEVAENESSNIIGYIFGAIFPRQPWRIEGRYAELESIYVKPEHQGAGLGAQLTRDFINWCRAKIKLITFLLYQPHKMKALLNFIEKLAFPITIW